MAKIKGADKFSDRLRRLERVRPEVRAIVYTAADELAAEAGHSITVGSVSGKHHVPSAPHTPPNANWHELDKSIHVEAVDDFSAKVVADAPHAVPLELGTSTIIERPFMRPAARKVGPGMARKVAKLIKRKAS